MSRLKRLIQEIHRRSLWQVLLIYFGGAWVCYEIIDTITDRLALQEWATSFERKILCRGCTKRRVKFAFYPIKVSNEVGPGRAMFQLAGNPGRGVGASTCAPLFQRSVCT